MKKKLIVFLAFSFGLCALTVSGGNNSVATTKDDEVLGIIIENLKEWSSDPTNATGCNSSDCCANATDAQCVRLAQEFGTQKEYWARELFQCIAANANFKCAPTYHEGFKVIIMDCETIPAAGPQLKAVGDCASQEASVRF